MKTPENMRIDQSDRGGFTDSNLKNCIQKDQIQQKLQSLEIGTNEKANQILPRSFLRT